MCMLWCLICEISHLYVVTQRDDIGIGGTWSEFVDYLISSLSVGDVKLIMSGQPTSGFGKIF